MAVVGAATTDGLTGAMLLGLFGAMYGLLYGLVSGGVVGVCTLGLRDRPKLVRRMRLLWGALAAGVVVLASAVIFEPPRLTPGPNETNAHVITDLLTLFVAPALLALLAGAWVVPRVITGRPRPAAEPAPASEPPLS